MAHNLTKTQNETIHTQAMDRYESIPQFERDNRKVSVIDLLFVHSDDGQWDDIAKEKRKNKPRYTINKLAAALDQAIGDQRQNRIQIKVLPVSGGADEARAKILSGLIKNIESSSRAESAYDAAFDESVTGGFGGWRVLTEFNDDDIFEQDIKIQPINSAASSLYFNNDKEISTNGEVDVSAESTGNTFADIQKDEWLDDAIETGSIVLKHEGVELNKADSLALITLVSMHDLNNKFEPKV